MRKLYRGLLIGCLTLCASITASANLQVTSSPIGLSLSSFMSNTKVFLVPEQSFY